MKTKKETMTLSEFVGKFGSQEAAAREIGVSWVTVSRWLNGHTKPKTHSLETRRLQELGITELARR